MSRYNLIDEEWIPVIDLNGNRKDLGILETLTDAENLSSIEDPSPLVTAALHRFLLAVLYRALEGPCDIDEAKKLFREGLPKGKIQEYLEKWRSRFWLFDENYPFGQNPEYKPKSWRSWPAIAAEHNADNAKVLFDHINVAVAGDISPAATTLWILATQTFAVSAGKSEISHTGKAPSAGSLMAIPIGRNLLDTFIFCLVPQNREILQNDLPMWERGPETLAYLSQPSRVLDKKTGKEKNRAIERTATGVVDLYTWRSRTIILNDTGHEKVKDLGIASGVGYLESTMVDPMVGYRIKEMKNDNSEIKIKQKFQIHLEDKGVWRYFDSLLPDDTQLAPKVIENAIELIKRNRDRFPKGVLVLGQRYDPPRPNISFWRKEFFALPGAITNDNYIRGDIHSYLLSAEDAGETLTNGLESFAKDVLRHGDRKVETKDVQNLIAQISSIPHYWSTLEVKFHKVLRDYTIEKAPEVIRHDWLVAVRNALLDSWKLHQNSLTESDAWGIRALVKAGDIIAKKIIELNKNIQILKEVP
jgi:CRISPR system Cascade subunit CasA